MARSGSIPSASGAVHNQPYQNLGSDLDLSPKDPRQVQTGEETRDENKRSEPRSSKTQWIRDKIPSSKRKNKHGPVGGEALDASNNDYRPPRPEIPSSSINALKTRSPLPLSLTQGPGFDQDSNHSKPAYVYSYETHQLERQKNDAHTSYRDTSSFGSTSAQAGTSWIEDTKPQSEPLPKTVPRRPLSMVSDLRTDPTRSRAKDISNSDRLQQLSHIETWVFGAMRKNPELAGPEQESAEDAIVRILDHYERLSTSLKDARSQSNHPSTLRIDLVKEKDEVQDANTKLQDSNQRLKNDNNRLQDACNRLQDNHSRLQESHNRLQNDNIVLQESNSRLQGNSSRLQDKIMAMDRKYKELEKDFAQESEMLNNQISSLKFQKNELVTSHGAKLRKDQNSQRREIEDLKKRYEDQLGKYEQDILKWSQSYTALQEIKVDLDVRLANARADANDRLREIEGKWDRKMQIEQREHQERVRNFESEIERLKSSLQNERSHKQEELLSQKKELLEKHEEEKVGLRTVIEDFKVASSRREHFKGLTDSEVAGQFKRLANSIEDFSRLEWDFSKEQQWPLTDSRMRDLGKNTRKMKQQIVQHTLWVLLYEYVFRSPFQILGEDGREYDTLWAHIYSSGASSCDWPEISADAERNRFETAKAFMDAVEPSASESGPKQNFETSIVAAMSDICRALMTVATITGKDRKSLESIVRLAAKTWLESCSQRYRLVMILSGECGNILSYGGTYDGTLMLVVRPDLKRYGDSQGKDLMRGEPLAGWKGLVEAYSQ